MKYTEKTYKKSLGFRIKKAREDAGLTQQQVSEQVEGGSVISRWEKNRRIPSIHQLATLASIFGTTMDLLYGRQHEQTLSKNRNLRNEESKDEGMV